MKFSPDTSRLVEGRWYWCSYDGGEAHRQRFDGVFDTARAWGDECPAPTVEVDPERPPGSELLPCPFCGQAPTAGESYVYCTACDTMGPGNDDDHIASAITAWNTRAAPTDLQTGRESATKPTASASSTDLQSAPAPAEPSPPAWVPPVCPAGQFYLCDRGIVWQRAAERPLYPGERFPPPAWPPRIGEHLDVDYGSGQWAHVPCQSAPMRDAGGRWYVLIPDGRAYRGEEGAEWNYVYRDLGYVPPGGGQ
jgi:hypothetical protein